MVIEISKVSYDVVTPDRRAVARMRIVLERQGQIEPLQVRMVKGTDGYVTFPQDPWGAETVQAARELGWTTILVAVMKRYEE